MFAQFFINEVTVKNFIYYTMCAGMLISQNCNAMREYRMEEECKRSESKLADAVFAKIDRRGALIPSDGLRPNPYDSFIDALEACPRSNRYEDIDFVIYPIQHCFRHYCKIENNTCKISDLILAIGMSAFKNNKSFRKVELPNNLLAIDCMAFAYTDIEELYVPDSVIAIAPFAFAKCEKLKTVNLSKNTQILNGAFAMCPNVVLRYRGVRRSQHGV